MNLRLPSLLLAAILVAACGGGSDRSGTDCDAPLPYAGKPLHAGPVALPAAGFTLGGGPLPAAPVARLAQALDEAAGHTKAAVTSAALATSAGVWSATRGADATPRMWWASAGKSLTAVVVMQLVAEGKLRLDDPLARWLPDFPNARAITVDHLLQHTAGVFSANEDVEARSKPGYRTPEDGFAIAQRHGPLFCPGQHWRYSNTGYAMLGRIIEAADGRPYHQAVTARIGEHLGLPSLRALGPGEEPADVAPVRPADPAALPMKPDWAYAAGCVVATPEDMLRFWHALLTGRLLGPERTAALFARLYPMFDAPTFYGRGVMLYAFTLKDGSGRTWLGHSGGTDGAKAVVLYSPADQAFVAVAQTGGAGAAGPEATANLLLSRLAGE